MEARPVRLVHLEAPPPRTGVTRTVPAAEEPREIFVPSGADDPAEAPAEAPPRPSLAALAALGLAAASAALAGCSGSAAPAVPAPGVSRPVETAPDPGTSRPPEAARPSAPIGVRLSELKKEDRRQYKRLAEANLYRHVLERVHSLEGAREPARQGLELFERQGDPEKLRDDLRALVGRLAEGPTREGADGAAQALARSAMSMGKALSEATAVRDPSLVDRLKTAGYEKALEQVQTLPGELVNRGVLTPEEARAAGELFTDTAGLALDAGRDLKDPALQAPLYEETLRQLYEKTGRDSSEISRALRQILDLALRLKDRLPGGLPLP